jgi:hypothetical protein
MLSLSVATNEPLMLSGKSLCGVATVTLGVSNDCEFACFSLLTDNWQEVKAKAARSVNILKLIVRFAAKILKD